MRHLNRLFPPSPYPLLLVITVCCLLLGPSVRPGQAQVRILDRVVAEVNGEIITLSQLNRELAGVEEQVLSRVRASERENALTEARQQLLAGMIDRLLVEQHAAKRGIQVGEREIDDAIARIISDNQLTMAELERDLERLNTTLADYRKELRAQILQSRLLSLEVRERVVIPESRIRQYYEDNYVGRRQEEAFHILQMGFTWQGAAPDANAEARRRAQAARAEVLAGGDFRELARTHSDLPSARDGGDLGVFHRDELAGLMLEHIPTLSPGEISPLIETAAGYQFFMLLSDRGDLHAQLPYEEARDEIREKLYNQALEEQFTKWVNSLREEAYIRIIL
ncbi:SurA N-terminal domain-containing protein [Desulfurivibrio sp. D14AmB]|uniref:peptidylprolyl isomerase n=1 Tax=Desulfurivibrio sp. D14AmB TaxID=3374370 RepID=UPI00376EB90F